MFDQCQLVLFVGLRSNDTVVAPCSLAACTALWQHIGQSPMISTNPKNINRGQGSWLYGAHPVGKHVRSQRRLRKENRFKTSLKTKDTISHMFSSCLRCITCVL